MRPPEPSETPAPLLRRISLLFYDPICAFLSIYRSVLGRACIFLDHEVLYRYVRRKTLESKARDALLNRLAFGIVSNEKLFLFVVDKKVTRPQIGFF